MQNLLGYEIRGLINAVRCQSPGPELSPRETLNATSRNRTQGRQGRKGEEHLIPENVQWTSDTCHVVHCCYGYWNAAAPQFRKKSSPLISFICNEPPTEPGVEPKAAEPEGLSGCRDAFATQPASLTHPIKGRTCASCD